MSKRHPSKEIPTTQPSEMETLIKSLWSVPPGLPTVRETRKHLTKELYATVVPAVWEVWRDEIPAGKENAVIRQVKRGIRAGINNMRLNDPMALWLERQRIPSYWEPPSAELEPTDLLPHQRQVFRLTAAFVALSVRNHLEDFHIAYTSDEHMPSLNRAIRNAVYGVLLSHPGHTWNIGLPARTFLQLSWMGVAAYELPPVAGS